MRTSLLFLLAVVVVAAAPSAKHVVGAKGTLMCGARPAQHVHVRLFRVQQGKKEDVNQVLDYKLSGTSGMFHVEGNTNGFPLNETDIVPVLTFYHACDEDAKTLMKSGYRKFSYKIPQDYVTLGAKAKKAYDLGTLNIQMEFPGETHDKKAFAAEVPTK